MKKTFIELKSFLLRLINKGKIAEQVKAGKKWDSIVEELSRRK